MITEAEFLEQLTEIFRSELDTDNLSLAMSATQSEFHGWDSLAHVRIVMRIESIFHVQFEATEIEEINSVRSFYDAVARHQG